MNIKDKISELNLTENCRPKKKAQDKIILLKRRFYMWQGKHIRTKETENWK